VGTSRTGLHRCIRVDCVMRQSKGESSTVPRHERRRLGHAAPGTDRSARHRAKADETPMTETRVGYIGAIEPGFQVIRSGLADCTAVAASAE